VEVMPTFDFTSPEGKKYSIDGPDGATRDEAFKMLQLRIAHEDQPKEEEAAPVTAMGLAKAAGSGLLRPFLQSGAMLGNAESASGINPQPQTPEDEQKTLDTLALHKPQNAAERYTDSVAGMVPQALIGKGSGIAGRLLTQAVAPGIASQAATDAGAGPVGSTLAAMAGGGLAGAAAAKLSAQKLLANKTMDEVNAATKAAYNDPELKNLRLQPQPVNQLGTGIAQDLEGAGHFREDHAPVFNALDRLSNKSGPVSFDELDAVRKSLGNQAGQLNEGRPTPTAAAAMRAKGHLDNFIDTIGNTNPAPQAVGNGFIMPNPVIASGNPAAARAALLNARGNAGAAIRADIVGKKLDNAQIDAATTNSGMNVQNRIRQSFKSYLKNDEAKMNGFTDPEKDAVNKLVRGDNIANVMRYAGNAMGGSGMTIGPYVLFGHPAVPAAGYALKKAANMYTTRQAQNVQNLLLSRAPVNAPTLAANRATMLANSQALRQRTTHDALRAAAMSLLQKRNAP
jgi:hypothetical protein